MQAASRRQRILPLTVASIGPLEHRLNECARARATARAGSSPAAPVAAQAQGSGAEGLPASRTPTRVSRRSETRPCAA
jgi:hypothetical protein